MRKKPRFMLLATPDNSNMAQARVEYYDTYAQAVAAAAKFQAAGGEPQVWHVVVRDRLEGTGQGEVENETVVYTLD